MATAANGGVHFLARGGDVPGTIIASKPALDTLNFGDVVVPARRGVGTTICANTSEFGVQKS